MEHQKAQREMTLEAWVARLPECHNARKEYEALKAEVNRLTKLAKLELVDSPDKYSDKINEAHPLETGRHDIYEQAMEMVGNRHGKYELVDLVNWLLIENAKHPKEKLCPECIDPIRLDEDGECPN